MRISYAIPVCNERVEIETLVSFLQKNKREQDEIVILFDEFNGSPKVEKYLQNTLPYYKRAFKGNFAEQKNHLNSLCQNEWIFQIDADEVPNTNLINNLPFILQSNPNTELFLVPRVNTVEGLTVNHIQKWGWKVDNNGWVNFPDYQTRIYQNSPKISWGGKVHEVILGHSQYSLLPQEEDWCLYHAKHITRQERQNEFYSNLGERPTPVGGLDPRVKNGK